MPSFGMMVTMLLWHRNVESRASIEKAHRF
jgi:hypothetical protein